MATILCLEGLQGWLHVAIIMSAVQLLRWVMCLSVCVCVRIYVRCVCPTKV